MATEPPVEKHWSRHRPRVPLVLEYPRLTKNELHPQSFLTKSIAFTAGFSFFPFKTNEMENKSNLPPISPILFDSFVTAFVARSFLWSFQRFSISCYSCFSYILSYSSFNLFSFLSLTSLLILRSTFLFSFSYISSFSSFSYFPSSSSFSSFFSFSSVFFFSSVFSPFSYFS